MIPIRVALRRDCVVLRFQAIWILFVRDDLFPVQLRNERLCSIKALTSELYRSRGELRKTPSSLDRKPSFGGSARAAKS